MALIHVQHWPMLDAPLEIEPIDTTTQWSSGNTGIFEDLKAMEDTIIARAQVSGTTVNEFRKSLGLPPLPGGNRKI